MRLTQKNARWFRAVVLTWTTLWMVAVPLVHVHPEADHRHGHPDHVHGGMVHTVFSPDLSCEFVVYDHASVAAEESSCPLHLVAQRFHGAEHPEIGVVLAASAKPQVGKGTTSDVAAHSFYANQPAKSASSWRPHSDLPLTNLCLAISLPSRAPPSV